MFIYRSTAKKAKNKTNPKILSEFRVDVVNKSLLRTVRRFVMREFRKDNKRLVKKRFWQVKAEDIHAGFVKTCNRLFKDLANIDSISQFAMIISGIKPLDTYLFEESVKANGDLVVKLMYDYSVSKFKKIFQINELKEIVRYILKNHPDDMHKPNSSKNQAYQANQESYAKMIDHWMAKFDIGQD